KIPKTLRETIARNIRECRIKKYPGRGGGKRCAEDFGVTPQQWSPWERGMRTPDELRLSQISDFFGVTVEYLRRDHSAAPEPKPHEKPEPPPGNPAGAPFAFIRPHVAYPTGKPSGERPDGPDTVYVPVFVLLPHLPDDMKALYDQFNATMNRERKPGIPPDPHR
ncbi:MAG: helix-turn-helix domain-containing protein, partial [Planctomycetes bacterium]|nr:helix-turn-helix domain-containing protein [Planctomycetota bacterium]